MADAPSGFTPQSFAPSLTIFQMISSNLHVDPYELNHSLYPKLWLMPHQVLHPSHLLRVWLFSDDFLKLACRSLWTKPRPVPQTMADAPSGFTPQSFAPSLTIFQMISSNLHVDPYTYNVFIWKRISYFWCSFSAFNHFFPQFTALIRVKWFLLILFRSLLTPIVLRNCFRIFVLSVFSLFVYISSTSILFEISSFTICVSESQFLINESFSGLLYVRFDKI